MKCCIRITQVYRIERQIEVDVDAVSVEVACELIEDGTIDVPAFDDPAWVEQRSLEHEICRAL